MTDDQQKQLAINKQKKLAQSKTAQLGEGKTEPKLKSGDDLALEALSQVSQNSATNDDKVSDANNQDDELAASDQLATTLTSLQNLIERNAEELMKIKAELKEKRESLRNVFDNDSKLTEAKQQADSYTHEVKARKSQLQADPQVTNLRVEVSELNEQRKEIEESLSNHLLNLYQLTNSTSFDTSDGDQWEFMIKARIKSRK
ncbi:MAG: hypothetical protein PVJ09_01655 [Candidatus Woesebacteria bacterium]|jgi:hypothetical protein